MSKKLIPLLITVLALVGIADAGYLTYQKWFGSPPPCTVHFKCQTVLESPWATLAGLPLSVWGLLYYSLVLTLGVLIFLKQEDSSNSPRSKQLSTALLLLASGGSLFSFYLLFLMGVILKAWCLYCLVSAINCQLILISSIANYWSRKHDAISVQAST